MTSDNYVSPKLLRPLREFRDVWLAALAEELASHECDSGRVQRSPITPHITVPCPICNPRDGGKGDE